jgi:replicative DNA helicase
MHDEICALQAANELEEADFYYPEHQEIFNAVVKLVKEGKPVSIVTLEPLVSNMSKLIDIGCEFAIPSQYPVYIEELSKCRQKREIVKICDDTIQTIDDELYLDNLIKSISDIAAREKSSVDPINHEATDAIVNAANKTSGISTGFIDIDNLIGGMHRGDLIIIAARPSMGKTALAMNIALNVMEDKKTVAVFSLETSKSKLLLRAACSLGKCRKDDIINQDETATKKALAAAQKIEDSKRLYIDDRSALTVPQIKARAMQIKQRAKGLDLIVVDYLQLVRVKQRKNGTREQEVAEVTKDIKAMGKDLDCPVLLLSQLSRQIEHRQDNQPQLSDLRESGAIEQDADIVIFPHRPNYFDPKADIKTAYAIVAKNKDGERDTVRLEWHGEWFRFSNDWISEAEMAEGVEI